eukprot:3061835-Pyramimonas_sp.AAC.1
MVAVVKRSGTSFLHCPIVSEFAADSQLRVGPHGKHEQTARACDGQRAPETPRRASIAILVVFCPCLGDAAGPGTRRPPAAGGAASTGATQVRGQENK